MEDTLNLDQSFQVMEGESIVFRLEHSSKFILAKVSWPTVVPSFRCIRRVPRSRDFKQKRAYVCRRLETRSHLRINELDAQVPFQSVFLWPAVYEVTRAFLRERGTEPLRGFPETINEIVSENNKDPFTTRKSRIHSTIERMSSRI